MTALVAALVVGGKGYGKAFAIEDGTLIIFECGRFLAWLERIFRIQFFGRIQHVSTPSKPKPVTSKQKQDKGGA
jgi:hypothetical protein